MRDRRGRDGKLPFSECYVLVYFYREFFECFISAYFKFEQGWCAKYTLQGALEQIDNKPWPPMNLRYI